MPLSSDAFQALDDTINRLAGESILAQAGRDDGLIPAYSLLSELCDTAAGEVTLVDAATAMRNSLEKLLDTAKPFDDTTLDALSNLVAWLPLAVAALKMGTPIPARIAKLESKISDHAPAEKGAEESLAKLDVLVDLHLEENRELLVEFHAEALDHLQQIEAALLALDEQPDQPEALNSIFRSFHTIKGVSGFLHLTSMHTLTHEVESLLDLARNRKLRLTSPIITEILRSRDAVQQMVHQITAALEEGKLPDVVIPVSHLISAVKRLAIPDQSGVAAVKSTPVADPISIATFQPAPVAPIVPFPVPENLAQNEASAKAKAPAASEGKAGSSSSVRVNTEKLDSLMDVVGELVIVQSQLSETVKVLGIEDSGLLRYIAQFGRLTKEMQHTAMSARMIPVKSTFQKLERLARDLSRDVGKKVNFHVSGEGTELDRTVVEDIGDPLVHMVRNSLDHGLELPAERVANGKDEAGNVHLKAFHEGGNIVIELSDDGRGIDPGKILAKAKKQNLVPENAQLSREEILGLIFLPGFSTAEKITAVSGRGVGMDVVKRNIDKLRGKIQIVSEVGKGSTFRIRLPLTMAIIDGLVVRVGADRFILPSTSVQMALRPTRESLSTVHGHGEVIDHRGKILPLHRLHRRFDIPNAIENPCDAIVVIMESNGRATALLVDDMVTKQEVVIKSLGSFLANISGVSGGAILGDGTIALILDPSTLFAAA